MNVTKKKTTEEPVVNPDVIVSSGKLDKKQGFAQNKKLRIAGYMLLAVLVVVGIGWLVKDNFHQTVITIGDTKITKKDITDYAAGLEKYQKDHPGSKFSDNLDQFALDKLILHAGLVNEAKKYNITLNDDDLLRSAGQQISDLQQKKQFLADIKAPGSKLIRYNLENQAYQAKLSDKLIAKKKLLALNLTLASPYFEDLPQAKVQAAYDTAKKRLQNDFLSQMNSGASTDSIIAKADTSWNQSPTSSDQTNTGNDAAKEMGMYFSESVVAAEVMDNYTKGSIQFTDPKDKSWVRGNIGKLYNPADKIESLKKVGTNTGIFASTNGAFMVIRLDGLSGGSYASWDDFLTHYKNQYVQGKLGTLANATGKYLNDSTQKAIDALTSIGIAKASAATDKVCNSNQYDVTVEGIDMWSGALVSGAKLDIYRDPNATYHRTDTASDGTVHDEYYTAANTCGAAGHNYAISGSSFTPNLDNWSRSGENFLDQTFNDSCWNVPPVFYVAAQANPSNWSPSNRSITNTNAVWANFPYNPAKASLASNGYGYDARDGSSGNGDVYEGFPNPPNGPALGGQPIEWYDNYDSPTNPSHLNAWHLKPGLANTRHYFVMLRYYPKWNRSGTSSVTPATASPGQKVTFKHKVGGTGAIDYLDGSTPPNGSASMTRPTATLERKVPGGSWTIVRSTQFTGSYSTSDAYTIPGSPSSGQYCERIKWNRDSGPKVNDLSGFYSDGYSAPACVDVSPNGGGATSHCTFTKIADDGTYNGYGTITYIDITDDYGRSLIGGRKSYSDGPAWHNLNYNPEKTPNVKVTIQRQYHDTDATGKPWVDYSYSTDPSGTYACWTPTCTLTVVGYSGPGVAVQGGTVTVRATMNNPLTSVPNVPLPETDTDGHPFAVNVNGTDHALNNAVELNTSVDTDDSDFTLPVSADATGHMSITGYPTVSGGYGRLGSTSCAQSIPVYNSFTLTPHPYAAYDDSEDPTQLSYHIYVDNSSGVTIDAGTSSCIYKNPPSNSCAGNLTGIANVGSFSAGRTYTLGAAGADASYAVPGPIVAGMQHCALINMPFTSGYFGPGGPGDIVGTSGGGPVTDCATVTDKPFYKVYGAPLSAGGDFSSIGNPGTPTACSGGGTLAGNFSNVDGAYGISYGHGASTQLSALALIKITGLASAQTVPTRSPTDLSFANTNPADISSSKGSPLLGGNYGGTHCIDDVAPPTPGPGVDSTTLNSDSVIATGGITITPGDNKSIFVNGDVYINGNIQYVAGWTANNAPSFVLKATGNIYIDPGVTVLDGVYIAKPTAAAATDGQIYTCGNGVTSPPFDVWHEGAIFDNCKNQLTVHGSFVARKINMMRSYGSLRDEKPTPGNPPGNSGGTVGVTKPLVWSFAGKPAGYNKCVNMNEPSEPGGTDYSGPLPSHGWTDNWLCVAPEDEAEVDLGWSFGDLARSPMPALAHCASLDAAAVDGDPYTWQDNYICSNAGIFFVYNSRLVPANLFCTAITEPWDNDVSAWSSTNKVYVCIDKHVAGSVTPATAPTPPAANTFPARCSNRGVTSSNRPTCAAEVFEYSPEIYLSQPAIKPPSNGAIRYDSISSLPPVL